MAHEVKDLLSVADGGPVDAPNLAAIQRRARRLTLLRGGWVAGAATVLVAALVGVTGGLVPSQIPLVGEGPEPSSTVPAEPTVPTEPDGLDAPETGPPLWTASSTPRCSAASDRDRSWPARDLDCSSPRDMVMPRPWWRSSWRPVTRSGAPAWTGQPICTRPPTNC
jgi:hypothetical protein